MSQDTDTPASQNTSPEKMDPQKRASPLRHPVLCLLSLLVLCVLSVGGWIWREADIFLHTPPSSPGNSLIIDIKPGATLNQIARLLEKESIITDAFRFQILARLQKKENNIQAGRFLVSTGWLPEKVLDTLVSGTGMLQKVTIREGLPWWTVAETLEKQGLCRAADFTSVIHDPEFLRHWGIPFSSAEGFLFPDTYLIPYPEEQNRECAQTVANRMVENFWKQAASVWPEKRPSKEELKKTVILASIVEKETGLPEERARVAGVYENRLQNNMLLQADPTVMYGLGRSFSGPLLRKHLDDKENRYNTYQNANLPPGPICSFGVSALQAAFHPEEHEFLYFVATGRDKGHIFSKTLEEHNKAVQQYRATQKVSGGQKRRIP